MPDTPDSLDRILRGARPKGQSDTVDLSLADDHDLLGMADMTGSHTVRAASGKLTRLHVVLKDGTVQSFQYNFLDARSTFEGGAFKLLFAGVKRWEITVRGHGPDFWRVYDCCSLHRCPYLREAVRDFGGDAADTVLMSITVSDVTTNAD